MSAYTARYDVSLLDDATVHLFNEGTLDHAHHVLGAHPHVADGVAGTCFAVWAPNAASVAVVGEFNSWRRNAHPMQLRGNAGIWEIFVAGVGHGDTYKYHIVSRSDGYAVDKADPYGYHAEVAPKMASRVWNLDYEWHDAEWMERRAGRRAMDGPMSIYEIHLGSWMRVPEENDRMLTYREIAPMLADYVSRMGFTHVELMPVMEHPYYASWGYQVTGYFAATSRYGTPQDLMFLIDTLHQRGIGVILDWVPSHFPTDAVGLSYFDGTHLYEHADPRKGHQPDWGSYIFNYGRYEVQNFLRSNALFWLERYHADGLRVDAVASMLHLDFSRKDGEWIPNEHGGVENLEAIDFIRRLNQSVYREHPDTETIAEDSTAWPMVTRPVYIGGLGFGLKWDMGWMHDTLEYFALDPIYRSYHHQKITFRMMYAFSENYVLPISHDEVVHGKGSLLNKMSGDNWRKRANMRALLGYMYGQTGKKFLFMGCEFGQYREWNHDTSLDWHLLQHPEHRGLQQWVADLNMLYRDEPAMHEMDNEPGGFEWVDCNDADQSIVSFLRFSRDRSRAMLVVCNFTPVPRIGFRVGVPESTRWDEVLNSDATIYGGSGWGNMGGVETEEMEMHGRPASIAIALPPLSISFFRMVPKPVEPADEVVEVVEVEVVEMEVVGVEVVEVEVVEVVAIETVSVVAPDEAPALQEAEPTVATAEANAIDEAPDYEAPDYEAPDYEAPDYEAPTVETLDVDVVATSDPIASTPAAPRASEATKPRAEKGTPATTEGSVAVSSAATANDAGEGTPGGPVPVKPSRKKSSKGRTRTAEKLASGAAGDTAKPGKAWKKPRKAKAPKPATEGKSTKAGKAAKKGKGTRASGDVDSPYADGSTASSTDDTSPNDRS